MFHQFDEDELLDTLDSTQAQSSAKLSSKVVPTLKYKYK